jgi:hypothetical protein
VLSGARWNVASAILGAALWLMAPLLPIGAPPPFGSIEHTFVFLPLVAAPLALLLLSAMLAPADQPSASFERFARYVQPAAAAAVLASFFVPNGKLAGGLAAAWLLTTVWIALGGGQRLVHARARGQRSNVSLLAAHVFLPVGAVWLLLSRLGVAPRNFSALTVFLAALHFHFSGFTLQILIAATGLRLRGCRPWLTILHRGLATGAIAGIVLIAAGNIAHAPVLKFFGVASVVVSTIALAITSTTVALNAPGRASRVLLLVSAVSLFAAMVLAGVYGIGELTGRAFIGVPRMVAIHGFLNAVGFTFCGLLGHLHLRLVDEVPLVER